MPRKARIDAPGALHHVMIRGIERRKIFWDDTDRDSFVDRLGNSLVPVSARKSFPYPEHGTVEAGKTPIR
jgi:hypothetical protein